MKPRERAFELDLLRGFALIMMMLHHLAFDLRYLFALEIFAFQEQVWFIDWIRGPFVMVFLGVSGICSTFTRSNAKRGLRLLLAALLFTTVSIIASVLSGSDLYILFNVLHLLSFGTLAYAGFEWFENRRSKTGMPTRRGDVVLLILAAFTLWAGSPLERSGLPDSIFLVPFGLPRGFPQGMADYMPIIPWLGFFIIGIVIGRTVYLSRTSAFPTAASSRTVLMATSPFRFVGRHALAVYLLHQPIVLGILYLMRMLGLF